MILPDASTDTLPKLFRRAALDRLGAVSMREKDFGIWQEVTWRDYQRHVERFALGLVRLGLKPGDRVCIQAENNQEWLYADLAVQSAGGVTVGVYPTNPAAEVAYVVRDSGAELFIAGDQEHVDKVAAAPDGLPGLRHVVSMSMKGLKGNPDPRLLGFKEVERLGEEALLDDPGAFDRLVSATAPDAPSVLIYTSGTTGEPKGAVITHRNLLESGKLLLGVLTLEPGDTHVSYLPLCHALERSFGITLHLMVGYVLHFAESIDTVRTDLQEVAPSLFITVPRILEKMQAGVRIQVDNSTRLKRAVFEWGSRVGARLARARIAGQKPGLAGRLLGAAAAVLVQRPLRNHLGLSRCKYVISGGAPLPVGVAEFFHGVGIRVRELFGMTELTTVTTLHYGDDVRIGTVGRVIPGWEARIAEDGELLFRGPGVVQGYWGRPEGARELVDDEGWLHTGDLAARDDDGQLRIIGRKKEVIITSGGKNVSPQFIESKLKGSPYIREALVVGDGRRYLAGLIQIETEVVGNWAQNRNLAFATIRDLSHAPEVLKLIQGEVDRVNDELSRVEQIKKFALIDKELYHEEGDLTATQKTKRKALQEKFSGLVESLYASGGGGA